MRPRGLVVDNNSKGRKNERQKRNARTMQRTPFIRFGIACCLSGDLCP